MSAAESSVEPAVLPAQHEPDAFSLMSGLLLALVGGLYLLGDLTSVDLDGRWVGPVVLIAVGLVGLLSTLRRTARRQVGGVR